MGVMQASGNKTSNIHIPFSCQSDIWRDDSQYHEADLAIETGHARPFFARFTELSKLALDQDEGTMLPPELFKDLLWLMVLSFSERFVFDLFLIAYLDALNISMKALPTTLWTENGGVSQKC